MVASYYECNYCNKSHNENTIHTCECKRNICDSCITEFKDTIIIVLYDECKYCDRSYEEYEEIRYTDNCDCFDGYYTVIKCPYCTEDIDNMRVDNAQIVEYVLKKYDISRENVIEEVKENRLKS